MVVSHKINQHMKH